MAKIRILASLVLVVVLAFCASGPVRTTQSKAVPARAALDVPAMELSKTGICVKVGQTKKGTVTGDYGVIKATPKDATLAEVSVRGKKVIVRGLSVGTTKVRIRGFDKNGKLTARATLRVKVKEEPVREEPDLLEAYAPWVMHTGEATFYDPSGAGAANLGDMDAFYDTAALNSEDYLNGLAGAYLEVTDGDGDVVCVLVTDLLPEGKKGDIDLSRKAFKSIEPPATGRMLVTWRVIALPTDEPVSFLWKPSSSVYWAQVQVRNHRYPIRSLAYYDEEKEEFCDLVRKDYNYFEAPDGMGGKGPFTFRITDIYGQEIIEKNIPMKANGKPVAGTQNFPALETQEA